MNTTLTPMCNVGRAKGVESSQYGKWKTQIKRVKRSQTEHWKPEISHTISNHLSENVGYNQYKKPEFYIFILSPDRINI